MGPSILLHTCRKSLLAVGGSGTASATTHTILDFGGSDTTDLDL